MAENNFDRNEHQNESTSEDKSSSLTKQRGGAPFYKIKKNICKFAMIAFEWVVAYFTVIKEWFTGKRGTRGDRIAMAVCLLIAVSLWLYVASTNDTGFEKQLAGVTVDVSGESALSALNMSIINGYDHNVTVTLKGKRGDIGSLTSEDLHMYVDVSSITESGRHTLPVMIDLPKNSSLVSIEPSHIAVNVDVNASTMVEVKVDVDYVMDASYNISAIKPDHEVVLVSGPKSVLDTIKYAGVSFDIGHIDKSLTLVGTIALYDEYDMVISNPYVKCSVSDITVSVKVVTGKVVPMTIGFPNGVSSNYEVTIHPSSLTIIGDPNLLKEIGEICAYTVHEGEIAVGDKLHISSIELPEGVSLADPDTKIDIEIERLY